MFSHVSRTACYIIISNKNKLYSVKKFEAGNKVLKNDVYLMPLTCFQDLCFQ